MRWDVARELDRRHDLPPAAVFETLYRSSTWGQIERGVGDPAAWREGAHQALETLAGRALPRLHEIWRAAQGPIEPNIALVRALRPPYKLAVLSNADVSLRCRLEEDMGIAHLFDDIVSSAEVGLAKPDPAIFRLAAERLDVPARACVFVDDWDLNVRAAQEVGMRGVLYRLDRGDDLRALLAAAGVAARG